MFHNGNCWTSSTQLPYQHISLSTYHPMQSARIPPIGTRHFLTWLTKLTKPLTQKTTLLRHSNQRCGIHTNIVNCRLCNMFFNVNKNAIAMLKLPGVTRSPVYADFAMHCDRLLVVMWSESHGPRCSYGSTPTYGVQLRE